MARSRNSGGHRPGGRRSYHRGSDDREYRQDYEQRYADYDRGNGSNHRDNGWNDRYDRWEDAAPRVGDDGWSDEGVWADDDDAAPPPGSHAARARRGSRGGRRARRVRRGKHLRRALIICGFAVLLGIVGAVAAFAIGYALTPIPNPNRLATSNTTVLYYSDGRTVLGSFAAQNRISVSLDQVPKHVQDAVMAAENRTFWTDKGISPTGIVRAAWTDFRGGSRQGGSTITQQYVKNFYLTQDRTWTRKAKELFVTLKVQRRLSKQEILQNYLNTSYFGRGAYGVETAAQAYFGKHAKDLSPEQGAVLAALLRAPSIYDPAVDPSNAKRLEGRYRYTLRGMAAMGDLSRQEAETAKLPKIRPTDDDERYDGPTGYLLVQARKELLKLGYTEPEIEAGGLRVTTTFDVKAQAAMEKAFAAQFPTQDAAGVHAGAAAVRPGTGEVIAMFGGNDYLRRQFNDASQAKIQPGSAFKPFALAAGLEKGITLRDRFAGNSPYPLADGHRVSNEFNRDYGKSVDLLTATRLSINTAYVDMTVKKLGPERVLDAAIRAGVPKDGPGMEPNPVVALGTAAVSPVDMANSYATFANGGQRTSWHVVETVKARSGEIQFEQSPKLERQFASDVVRDVNYALQEVVRNGTGEEAGKLHRPIAGKTGTAEDKTAWFIGYTPQLSTSVGFYRDRNNDGVNESLDGVGGQSTFFGGGYPARIWTSFMRRALAGLPVEKFAPPARMGMPTAEPEPTVITSTPSPDPTTPLPEPTLTTPPVPPPTTTPEPDPEPTSTKEPGPSPTRTFPTWPPRR